MAKYNLRVNGKNHSLEADADMPLLYALRNDLKLNGPKFGCGLGQCGSCTVILEFAEVPDLDIVLINRPEMEPLGAGEGATITPATSIANAIYDAVGARLREGPFTPARVLAALQKS